MRDSIKKVRSARRGECKARKPVRTKAAGLGDKRCGVGGIAGDNI